MSVWTVYDHPTDFPNNYVARRFEISEGGELKATDSIIISPDLETLRRVLLVETGLTCLARMEGDDPKIVETWI